MKHDSAQAVAASSPAPSIPDGVWLVRLESGIVSWSLDELDLAFQRGDIDAATPVRTSGMTEWQTLGIVADLDAAPANDTAPPQHQPQPQHQQRLPPPRPSMSAPPAPPAPPPRRSPPPLDGKSFPPTTTAVFGNGASVWSSITPPPSELQTGVRRNVGVVPFALRRTFGSAFDFGANLRARLRATHPRWAAVGPWLFGAGLSAVFAFVLYHLANAPMRPGPHTRSGPPASYAAAAAPSAAPATPSPKPKSLPSRDELVATARASIAADDGAESVDTGSDVLRPRDLKLAPGRSEPSATSSARAKAKARAKARQRAKARAARKARRSRAASFGD